jgi:hypothetical protein
MSIKKIIILILILVSTNSFGMFVFHTAYWSGCVQGKVNELGMSKSKHSDLCKSMAEKQTFKKIPYNKENEIIEESTVYYFKGCSSNIENDSLCHDLTKKYHKDMTEIFNSVKDKYEK